MPIHIFEPTIDAYMEGIIALDTNFGAQGSVQARAVYTGEDKTLLTHGLGNFDVSAVSGATITSASLWLYHFTRDGTPLCNIERCKGHDGPPDTGPDWVEDEVTWNDYSTGNAWTGAGGDVDAVNPTAVQFNLAAGTGWQEVEGLKGHVDDAIASRGNIVSLLLSLDDEEPGVTQGHLWYDKDIGSLIWYLEVKTPTAAAVAGPALGSANMGIY